MKPTSTLFDPLSVSSLLFVLVLAATLLVGVRALRRFADEVRPAAQLTLE
jgi:hypothetical protein